ncbi:hypothetical protein GWG65_03805 [Bradyrhizobium sp. CSA207]|uniref:hypothetical protein n=1 Tax=Bradyrhizobium sp. CSA207 TaxID=2698826 RepID=UPI0023AF0466|nr:hypothetical protein [Bradyrhizobium sp. CSA207]MDE5440589.1 hypothetical protein [Bradyrhizobium sp. CSA207]
MLTQIVVLLKSFATAQSWRRAFTAALLSAITFAPEGLSAAASDANKPATLRGPEAFKVLVGNTLRSVGDSKLIPTFRYFMSDQVEYRCRGWDPSGLARRDIRLHSEAGGCELLFVALKEGRLCESYQYEQCQDHELKLTFARRSDPTKVAEGEVLGRVTLPGTDRAASDPIDHDLIKGKFELVKGNGTIFPNFDPVPKPELLRPDTLPLSLHTQDFGKTLRSVGLSDAEATSKIIGNTMVRLGPDGKPDGRAGEYYGPDGRITVISIPKSPEGADLLHLSAEAAGTVFINRWKIENGGLCRTENDEPTKFICAVSLSLEAPEQSGDQAAPRYFAGNSGIGPRAYIAKGNPFGFDFGNSTRK